MTSQTQIKVFHHSWGRRTTSKNRRRIFSSTTASKHTWMGEKNPFWGVSIEPHSVCTTSLAPPIYPVIQRENYLLVLYPCLQWNIITHLCALLTPINHLNCMKYWILFSIIILLRNTQTLLSSVHVWPRVCLNQNHKTRTHAASSRHRNLLVRNTLFSVNQCHHFASSFWNTGSCYRSRVELRLFSIDLAGGINSFSHCSSQPPSCVTIPWCH